MGLNLFHLFQIFSKQIMERQKNNDLYDKIWQAGAILLNTKTVGVMGDERTYQYTIALRAVNSIDGMTATCYRFDMDFIESISNEIINKVKNKVLITHKVFKLIVLIYFLSKKS